MADGCPTLHSASPDETRAVGARLAGLLQPGDVLLLQGELGAGKTMFTRGIGEGLDVDQPVRSSSFVLMNEYHGRLTLYHADLFRLTDPLEVADLALEEIAAPGVLVVEWPERAWDELPPEHLLVRLEEAAETGGESDRTLTLVSRGDRYQALAHELGAS